MLVAAVAEGNNNKEVLFQNCDPIVLEKLCMSEVENTQIDNAKYIDVVMPLHDLI